MYKKSKKKIDKRVIKTRSAVFNAVLELAAEKELNKITVVELCDRANINKSTFYLHYKDKNDCLEKCFDYLTDRVLDCVKDIDYNQMSVAPEETVKKILDSTEENLPIIKKFKDTVIYASVISNLKTKVVDAICKNNNINIKDNYHEVAKVAFLVGGCADLIIMFTPDFNRDEVEKIMVNTIKRR